MLPLLTGVLSSRHQLRSSQQFGTCHRKPSCLRAVVRREGSRLTEKQWTPFILWASVLIAGISSAVAQTPADVYKPGNDVTTPVVVTEVKPSYPPEAMRRGVSGAIKLECIVETDGTVSAIRVTTPLDPDLDAAAVAALNQWRFKPAMKDGKAVRASIDVEMTFTMRGRGPRLDSAES